MGPVTGKGNEFSIELNLIGGERHPSIQRVLIWQPL